MLRVLQKCRCSAEGTAENSEENSDFIAVFDPMGSAAVEDFRGEGELAPDKFVARSAKTAGLPRGVAIMNHKSREERTAI
jgi:hypothetical protein